MQHVVASPVVPAEFVGKARRLRAEIAAAELIAEQAIHRIWHLVRANAARRCPPSEAAAKLWRRQVPTAGCLARSVEWRPGSLRIVEHRMGATKFRAGWEGDDYENSICCVRYTMTAEPMLANIHTITIGEFSLHAIARRFQRGVGGDAAVLTDMHAMAAHRDALLDAAGEFDVAAGDGRWVGNIAEITSPLGGLERIVSVRSFLPDRGDR